MAGENSALPTVYQSFIHMSRYSRFDWGKGRRETWSETVDRWVNFFGQKLGNKFPQETRDQIRDSILALEVMPSMRTVMTAGAALDRDHIAAYNCVSGDTPIVTQEYGLVPISCVVGQDVTVLNQNGWVHGHVQSFGKQKLLSVRFTYNTRQVFIKTTADHEWLLTDGRRVKTRDLSKGDRVPYVNVERDIIDHDEYKKGVIHGLIYGDGTATHAGSNSISGVRSHKRAWGYQIRVCGDHDDVMPWFEDYKRCYPSTYAGDPHVYVNDDFARSKPLKELPDETIDERDYLIGFFRGWFAADGSGGKQPGLCCSEQEADWVKRVMSRFGYVFHKKTTRLAAETNYGPRKKLSVSLGIDRACLRESDFLIKRKFEKTTLFNIDSYSFGSIEETDLQEEVFCPIVPDGSSWVTDMGMLTGNCSFLAINRVAAFDELLYILMCGTGVGFSVERQHVSQLPTIAEEFHKSDIVIQVQDSKMGWAKALKELISLLYAGQIPSWDTSKVRPAGAPLMTFGGRASGPEPLVDLFRFAVDAFKKAAGRKLTSLEAHDLVCKIADIVVVGGVRRSALISLSNLSDDRMRSAKSGQWWENYGHRRLANNSAAYTEKPEIGVFMDEWKSLYDSKSGERGIFNRMAAKAKCSSIGRDPEHDFGTNPCGEIILRDREFCNLSEVIIRATDTPATLLRKVELATIIGTLQSTLTDFKYISKKWQTNCEEERLLGVSLTGIMDSDLTNGKKPKEMVELLKAMRDTARTTNEKWAKILGINPSAAITCVKPSGTVSQLVNSGSGIHARHSRHYIRRARMDIKDPLAKIMLDSGFKMEPDVMKPDHTMVVSFPIETPKSSVMRDDMTAVEQLEHWKIFRDHWCDHNPSITVTVREHEWMDVGAWVYRHFDEMTGVSFLPHTDHVYKQAPYEEVDAESYKKLVASTPVSIDWSALADLEKVDGTTGSQELACTSASGCEII